MPGWRVLEKVSFPLQRQCKRLLGYRQYFLQITGDSQLLSSLEGSSETERSSVNQLSEKEEPLP